uniref:Uncharacterized protein n=1 Tax=Arundo donax TaxID=35708 RepID=A0A0A8Y7N0_ARUDO
MNLQKTQRYKLLGCRLQYRSTC